MFIKTAVAIWCNELKKKKGEEATGVTEVQNGSACNYSLQAIILRSQIISLR